MEKNYIELYLNENNIKKEKISESPKTGKKYNKVCVSFPSLGLVWLTKKQTIAFKDKNNDKSENKKLKIVLSADEAYTFYKGKNKEPIVKTGLEIMDFYQAEWKNATNKPEGEKKVYVSTKMITKTLKETATDINSDVDVQEKVDVETKVNSQTR